MLGAWLIPMLGELPVAAWGIGGTAAIVGGALALGIRHGIDWDHIAAITDITSTSSTPVEPVDRRLTAEPGVQLTDESHHRLAHAEAVPHEHDGGRAARLQPALAAAGSSVAHGADL